MNHFASNLKRLRSLHKLSQASFAEKISVSRANVAKYEGAIHEPSIEVLVNIARYFEISLDALVTSDLNNKTEHELLNVDFDSTRILPIQVDSDGNDVIEVVPHSAEAGYTGMYADRGFIESMDHLRLPLLNTKGKCRAFPVNGDSMPPYGNGSFVIGKYVQNRSMIKEGERYILILKDDGIVFKRVYFEQNELILESDNPKYKRYSIHWSQILEIWQFVAGINLSDTENTSHVSDMLDKIETFQSELQTFKKRLSKRNE